MKAALTSAEDEVATAKSRSQFLSAKNVDLARENAQHKVCGDVLEEENAKFSRQMKVIVSLRSLFI